MRIRICFLYHKIERVLAFEVSYKLYIMKNFSDNDAANRFYTGK
jgi:hypothetical protein